MRIRMLVLSAFVFFSSFYPNASSAEVFERYVTFTLDDSQITQIQSGGLDVFELSTGFSETFEPAQLQGVDMINVYADFVDQQGNKLYVVLKDLGGQYLYPNGWQWFQVSLGLDMGTVSGTYVNGWVFTESVPDRPGNFACCTETAVSQSVIESTGFGFNVTDSTITIGQMRFQFNFNNFTDPVVITGGGGFDRLSLKIRAESVALSSFPEPGTLFDNGSFSGFQEQSRNNMCAQFDDAGNCTSRFTIYDQFVLEGNSVITGIRWHQTEQQPENYMGTLITIGSGIPSEDSLLHTFLVLADRVLTLIPDDDPRFNSLPNGSFEALASVSELEILLAEGTYWLGIHNIYPQFGGSSQWSQTTGTDQTIPGRWQGEGVPCGAFPTGPDGGCLKYFPNEDSAFRVIGETPVIGATPVSIDIKPGSDPNSTNLKSKGKIPVAVLTTDTFYAPDVNFETVRFGPAGATESHERAHVKDVDRDGNADVVLHFKTQETGIQCGDTEATLTGMTFGGQAFTGTDSIKIVKCH